VLVAKDLVPPFAMPDGQIFVSPKWVAGRRLTDAEIALVLAHEVAHVLSEHMLERVSTFAAARPAMNMRRSCRRRSSRPTASA
jgi:Zn-dependent protease with chaperone function